MDCLQEYCVPLTQWIHISSLWVPYVSTRGPQYFTQSSPTAAPEDILVLVLLSHLKIPEYKAHLGSKKKLCDSWDLKPELTLNIIS